MTTALPPCVEIPLVLMLPCHPHALLPDERMQMKECDSFLKSDGCWFVREYIETNYLSCEKMEVLKIRPEGEGGPTVIVGMVSYHEPRKCLDALAVAVAKHTTEGKLVKLTPRAAYYLRNYAVRWDCLFVKMPWGQLPLTQFDSILCFAKHYNKSLPTSWHIEEVDRMLRLETQRKEKG